jgi:hypothetical protein
MQCDVLCQGYVLRPGWVEFVVAVEFRAGHDQHGERRHVLRRQSGDDCRSRTQ